MDVPTAYDALGRRIMKEDSLNAANTRYYYYNDNWQIVTEYDLPTSAGVYKQLYAYGNYIDEVVYASCPGATYTMRRYLHDHLYSPAAIVYLTASNCILVERSEYDAYGAAHYYNADYTQTFAVSQHGNPFAFTGREVDSFDFASGVPQLTKMHYRHRDYSPFMGRFYQEDMVGQKSTKSIVPQIQYQDSLNLYEYGQSIPISKKDPLGLLSTCSCKAVLPKLLQHNDVKPLYDRAKKATDMKGEKCLKDVFCGECNDPNWGGVYSFSKKTIQICTGNPGVSPGNSLTMTRIILKHELLHAIQCDPSRNCSHCMRKEMESYYHSGECGQNPAAAYPMVLPNGIVINNSEEECLYRASFSCAHLCAGKPWYTYVGRFPFPPDMPNPPREN